MCSGSARQRLGPKLYQRELARVLVTGAQPKFIFSCLPIKPASRFRKRERESAVQQFHNHIREWSSLNQHRRKHIKHTHTEFPVDPTLPTSETGPSFDLNPFPCSFHLSFFPMCLLSQLMRKYSACKSTSSLGRAPLSSNISS